MKRILFIALTSIILIMGIPTSAEAGKRNSMSEARTNTIMIGDSLTYWGRPDLKSFRPDWIIDGVGGRLVGELPERVDHHLEENGIPNNLIIALGTNNTASWTKQDYVDQTEKVPSWVRVYFVTTYKDINGGDNVTPEQVARQTELSGWMQEIANERDRTYIIPWRNHVIQGKVELRDAMHATHGEGELYWAKLVRNTVGEFGQ